MKCPTCSSEMHPLLTSMYCPNEERHAKKHEARIAYDHGANETTIITTWYRFDGKTWTVSDKP